VAERTRNTTRCHGTISTRAARTTSTVIPPRSKREAEALASAGRALTNTERAASSPGVRLAEGETGAVTDAVAEAGEAAIDGDMAAAACEGVAEELPPPADPPDPTLADGDADDTAPFADGEALAPAAAGEATGLPLTGAGEPETEAVPEAVPLPLSEAVPVTLWLAPVDADAVLDGVVEAEALLVALFEEE